MLSLVDGRLKHCIHQHTDNENLILKLILWIIFLVKINSYVTRHLYQIFPSLLYTRICDSWCIWKDFFHPCFPPALCQHWKCIMINVAPQLSAYFGILWELVQWRPVEVPQYREYFQKETFSPFKITKRANRSFSFYIIFSVLRCWALQEFFVNESREINMLKNIKNIDINYFFRFIMQIKISPIIKGII